VNDRTQLIQEDYMDSDFFPWKVLVICICLNRSSWMHAEVIIKNIFNNYSNPVDLATAEWEDVFEMVRSLGCGVNRAKSLIYTSVEYSRSVILFKDDYEKYPVNTFRGCGQYAMDAWTLFVLEEPCCPYDRLLKKYAERVGLYDDSEK